MKFTPLYILAFAIFLSGCSDSKNLADSNLENTSELDRSKAPEPGPAPVINMGSYEQFQIENGLTVILVENNKLPRVSYSINIEIPPIMEEDKAGYVSLVGSLLESGTSNRTKAEIAEEVDFIGARMSAFPNGISGSCLSKHSETLLEVMSDVLLNPTFPQEELDKIVTRSISGLASAETNANSISGNISARINFGTQHPYGELETEESLKNITTEDIRQYYLKWFRPNSATLTIVGDINKEEAEMQVKEYFGSWKSMDVPNVTMIEPLPPAQNRVVFVPLEGAVQSVIRITYPLNFSVRSHDYLAASVMNNILGGGGFYSRLNQNIREDKGYTYSAGSSLNSDQFIGSFVATASVRNEVTDSAIVEFLYELDRMYNGDIDQETLQLVKNNMNGKFALALERPQTVARFASNIKKYKLPSNYYETYLDRLAAITVEDVQAAAKKYILPENLNIVVVGNKDEVAESLAKFSKDNIVEFYDIYGEPWKDIEEVPADVTVESVLDKYIEVIGGEDRLKTIEQYTQKGSLTMSGMALQMTSLYKQDNRVKIEIMMGGQAMMTNILNGDSGVMMQAGQKMEMSEKELLEAKLQADLLAPKNYDSYGVTAELKGIQVVEGVEAYVVELRSSIGKVSKDYYSVADGFKIKSESEVDTGMGVMTVKSTYSEYKEFEGLKVPTVVKVQTGPQSYEMNVSSMDFDTEIEDSEFEIE